MPGSRKRGYIHPLPHTLLVSYTFTTGVCILDHCHSNEKYEHGRTASVEATGGKLRCAPAQMMNDVSLCSFQFRGFKCVTPGAATNVAYRTSLNHTMCSLRLENVEWHDQTVEVVVSYFKGLSWQREPIKEMKARLLVSHSKYLIKKYLLELRNVNFFIRRAWYCVS
jgi:hypothetical protein